MKGVGAIFFPELTEVKSLNYPSNYTSGPTKNEWSSAFAIKGDELRLFQEEQIALHRKRAVTASSESFKELMRTAWHVAKPYVDQLADLRARIYSHRS